MKPEAKQITVAAKLKGPFVFGSQLLVQQLAECALLLAKDSAGKQSNKTLYLPTVSILKALYLLAVSVLKAMYLLAVSCLKALYLSPSTPQFPPSSHQAP